MNIDFGTAFHKRNGNAVKVTVMNSEIFYISYKRISMDGDTGQWYPPKQVFLCQLMKLAR